MSGAGGALREGFDRRLREDRPRLGEGTLVVACSGGLDSTVLFHLLRFASADAAPPLHVAHVQHRMRPDAEADARWLRGLCRAWDVPCTVVHLDAPPGSETEAREARMRALAEVRERAGARWVALAHHRDDQAETVLHRMARGTGLDGLAAMRRFGAGGHWRPLLSYPRAALAAYAREARLTWREDATNARTDRPRNVLRHVVLPELERRVAPGAARHLAELADAAAGEREAWDAAMPYLLEAAGVRREGAGALSMDAAVVAAWPAPLRARVARAAARELGSALGRAGTRVAAEFMSSGTSGHAVDVGGGLRVERQLERVWMRRTSSTERAAPDESLVICAPGSGEAGVCIGGRRWRVRWDASGGAAGWAHLIERPRYPLMVRSRRPGDRICLHCGTKKLKKVLLEARVPAQLRDGVPVVVDRDGRVMAVAGLTTAQNDPAGRDEAHRLALTIDPLD